MFRRCILVGASAIVLLASAAQADDYRIDDLSREVAAPSGNWLFGTCTGENFSDNFDSYSPGNLCDQSSWEEWTGSTDVCGIVTTDQAFSPPNSLHIIGTPPGNSGGGDDTVHVFNPTINGGVWTFSVMTYVPTGMTGHGWIILQNQYPTNINWSLQVHLQDNGMVHADFTDEEIPLIFDQWVEFRAEIDLVNDSASYFYGGTQFVFDNTWTTQVGVLGITSIASIDLYGGDATSPGGPTTGVYFDDVQMIGNPGCGDCDPCDMNCDGEINAFDIEPFLDLLFGPGPPCAPCTGDVNGDGVIDAFDIEPFLNCLFP